MCKLLRQLPNSHKMGKRQKASLQDSFIILLLPLSIKVVLDFYWNWSLVWSVWSTWWLWQPPNYTSVLSGKVLPNQKSKMRPLWILGMEGKNQKPFCLVRIALYPPGTGSAPECITCWNKGRDLLVGIISILTILHLRRANDLPK